MDTKKKDIELWNNYKATNKPEDRAKLLRQFEPIIFKQVNKWSGVVPNSVLTNEAKLLALKAFDTYDPKKGTQLSSHVVNNLAPISRVVYSHQNTARLPENITLKIRSYNQAVDHLTTVYGREPTTDELHQELGWPVNELNRIQNYMTKDLVESKGGLNDKFYSNDEDEDADLLNALYFDLTPQEKQIMEYRAGFNGKPKLSNPEIMKKLGLNQSQFSYKLTLLTNKIQRLTEGRR